VTGRLHPDPADARSPLLRAFRTSRTRLVRDGLATLQHLADAAGNRPGRRRMADKTRPGREIPAGPWFGSESTQLEVMPPEPVWRSNSV
jgi:hypothetical protein